MAPHMQHAFPCAVHRSSSVFPPTLHCTHTHMHTRSQMDPLMTWLLHLNLLSFSIGENPMGGGAWWAAVHGVAKSRALLSGFTFTFHFHAFEEEMAPHSSVLAWRIPGTGEPGGLPSMGSHRVGQDSSDLAAAAASPLKHILSCPPPSAIRCTKACTHTHTHTSIHSCSHMYTYVYSPEPQYGMASPVFTCMGSCCLSRFISFTPNSHTRAHTHIRSQRVLLLLHAQDSVTCPFILHAQPPKIRHTKIHIYAHAHTDTHTFLHPGAHNSMAFPIMMHVGHVAFHPSSPTSSAHSLSEPLWPWEPAGLAQFGEETRVFTCVHCALLLWDS